MMVVTVELVDTAPATCNGRRDTCDADAGEGVRSGGLWVAVIAAGTGEAIALRVAMADADCDCEVLRLGDALPFRSS